MTDAPRVTRADVAISSVGRFLGLRHGQSGRAFRMLSLVFVLSAALALMKAAQSGIFLAAYPREAIPWAFAASAVSLATLSSLSVTLASKLGPARLATWTMVLSILSIGGLRAALLLPDPGVRFAVYVVIEAASGLLVIQSWSITALATDARSARRLLPVAGLGAGAAWTLSGLAVPALVSLLGVQQLLLIAPFVLVLSLWLLRVMIRQDLPERARRGRRGVGLVQGWRDGFGFVARQPLMRLLALLSVLMLVTEQVMDFQLMATAQEALGEAGAIASFFGGYYSATSAISIVVLAGLSGRVLSALGATRSLVVTPLAIAAAAVAAIALPGLATAVVLRGTGRVLKQAMWSSSAEQMQTPLPELRRAQARSAIRGVVSPTGYGVAALALSAWPASLDSRWLAAVVMVTTATMVVIILWRARGVYMTALHEAVDERRLLLGQGRAPAAAHLDRDACAALSYELRGEDATRATLAAEVLGLSGSPLAVEVLLGGLAHDDPNVRLATARGLSRLDCQHAADVIADHLAQEPEPPVRVALVDALSAREPVPPAALEALARGADDPDPDVAAVCRVAHVARSQRGEALGAALRPLLDSALPRERDAALAALTREAVGAKGVQGRLHGFVHEGEVDAKLAAAHTIVRLRLMPLLPDVVRLLKDPRTAAVAARSIVELGGDDREDDGADDVAPLTSVRTFTGSLSRLASRIAHTAAPPVAEAIVLRLLEHPDAQIRHHATRALGAAIRAGRRAALPPKIVRPLIRRDVTRAYMLYSILAGLAHDDGVPDWDVEEEFEFLAHEVELRIEAARQDVLASLLLSGRRRLVSAVEVGRRKPSPGRDAQVAELLDMGLDSGTARRVVPLFERLSLRERVEAARRLGYVDEHAVDDPLDSLVGLDDAHLRRCALVTYGARFERRFPELAAADADVVPLFERMRFLRSVPLFHDLSGDDVLRLAELVEQVEHAAGELVFEKGDPGEDLYLVVGGRVAVVDGEVRLAELGEREFFGDLAVLDHQPRSADVVCVEDTRLLRLRAADMEELMATRPETMREFVRVLAQRLRLLSKRVAE